MRHSTRRPSRLIAVSHESEAEFQAAIIQLAELHRWRWYHSQDSRRDPAGLPDLILVRPPRTPDAPGRFIVAEVKRAEGKLRPEQREWLADLATCPGVETYVWYPVDFEEIKRVLA